MNKRSPSTAVGLVLGAVACIVLLAYLAACGGGGGSGDGPEAAQFGRLNAADHRFAGDLGQARRRAVHRPRDQARGRR